MNNFIPSSSEEQAMLFEIKCSYPCWQTKKLQTLNAKTRRSRKIKQVGKYAAIILGLYLLIIAIGPLCGIAKDIAIYFKNE